MSSRITLAAALAVMTAACGDATDAPVAADVTASAEDTSADAGAATYTPLTPVEPVLVRLTQAHYRNTVRALLGDGLALPSTLEPDPAADGLPTVGASVSAISPRGAELYEEAAISLGLQAIETPERMARVLPCAPSGATDEECFTLLVESFGRRAWRRPLTTAEVARHVALGVAAATALDGFDDGVAWIIAAMLQSPHFLYRTELGEDDPSAPGARRYTSWEMASRLSFFLWSSVPDDALLAAAEAGELTSDDGLRAQAERLLADDRAREAVRGFVTEWLRLDRLDDMSKDPNIFKHFSPELGGMAREETLRLAEHLVFDKDADLGELFVTRTTFVNPRLAALYNIPAPSLDGFGQTTLPADGERRGFLGHVSFLGLHSHPTTSSATQRGLFVRENLLCDLVPNPPADLNTAIPEASSDAPTLRDRLLVHMLDPSCAGCHKLTDLVGLGFELFDGIGRFRLTENDVPIDPSGGLDGVEFASPVGLAEVVASSPKLTACVVRKLYGYAVAHPISVGELGQLAALTDRFEAGGRRLRSLMALVVMSEGFRRVGDLPATEGE